MISCKAYTEIKKEELREKIELLKRKPKLCVVQVGDNPASNSYIKGKKKDCEEVGIDFRLIKLPDDISQKDLENTLDTLDWGDDDGIIVQLPLPDHIDVKKIANRIPIYKDVDGFRGESLFKPCTPKGIIDWLKFNGYEFAGKDVVVLGRSEIVGKPLTNMLIDAGATVTCCNSRSDVMKYTKDADLVISAVGKAKHFDYSYFDRYKTKVIVDVGINRDEDGKLCGDMDSLYFEANLPKTYVTRVPGGVGLLTRYALLENVFEAYTR